MVLLGCTLNSNYIQFFNRYNIFVSLFQGQIESAVRDALNNNVPQAITGAVQDQLNSIDLQVPIADPSYGVFINFHFKTINFNTPSQYLTLGAAGEFVKKGVSPYPGEPVALPDRLPNNTMIQVFLTEYVLSSAGYAFHMAGVLSDTLRYTDVPASFPFKLNTKTFQYLIPTLYQKYPDANMNLVLATAKPPTGSISPAIGVEVDADAFITFQVVMADNKTTADCFTVELDLLLDLKAAVSGSQVISSTVSYKNATLALKSSNIGAVDVNSLQATVKLIIQYGVLPYVNAVTQKGFPIVSGDFQLQNPQIGYQQGYIVVASDFTFKPSLYDW